MERNPMLQESQINASRLRDAGLRATGPRLAILAELDSDTRHPSAEMLLDTLLENYPSMSLSTVYATLETFLQKGLIRRIAGPSGKLRVDGTAHEHDHAVCRCCGTVYDIASDEVQRPTIPNVLSGGLRVMKLNIEYEVLCRACVRSGCPDSLA